MATTTWNIAQMERHLPDGSTCPEGSVYTIHWTATYEDNGESVNSYGSVGLGEPSPDNFVPFNQVTKEKALEWLFEALGPDQVVLIQENLYNMLENKVNPTSASGNPWDETPSTP